MSKPRTYKGHNIIDGLAYNTVLTRVHAGWDVERACTTTPMPLSDAAKMNSSSPWRNKGAVGYFASMKTRYRKK